MEALGKTMSACLMLHCSLGTQRGHIIYEDKKHRVT